MKTVNRNNEQMRILNPKNHAAMKIAFERVQAGVFDEYDIHFLLGGIRPVARETFYKLKKKKTHQRSWLTAGGS